jgi:AAA domain
VSGDLITLVDVQRREVVWLEHGTVPRGMLTLLAGHPGLGKSLWAIGLAAEQSRAGRDVVICSAEDSLEHSIKPRLQACGADTSRIHALVPRDENGDPRGVSFPSDAPTLLAAIRQVDAVLAIVDPITAHLDSAVDSHKDASLRSALAPLSRIAEETLAALLGVMHLNKNGSSSDPMMRLGGSIGGPGQARSALLLDRDPDDPEKDRGRRRVMAHFKSNVSPLAPSRLLEVQAVELEASELEPPVKTARIVDLGESQRTAAEILHAGGEGGHEASALDEAIGFLHVELGQRGEITSKQLDVLAASAGISKRTLERARAAIGLKPTRRGFGSEGYYVYVRPSIDRQTPPTSSHVPLLAAYGGVKAENGASGADSPYSAAKPGDEANHDGDDAR